MAGCARHRNAAHAAFEDVLPIDKLQEEEAAAAAGPSTHVGNFPKAGGYGGKLASYSLWGTTVGFGWVVGTWV